MVYILNAIIKSPKTLVVFDTSYFEIAKTTVISFT